MLSPSLFKIYIIITKPTDAPFIAQWIRSSFVPGQILAKVLYCGAGGDQAKSEKILSQFKQSISSIVSECATQVVPDSSAAAKLVNKEKADMVVLAQTRVARPTLRVMKAQRRPVELDEFIARCNHPFLLLKKTTPFSRVLFATDDSRDSRAAQELFLQIPLSRKPSIYVVNVISDVVYHFSDYLGSMGKQMIRALEKIPTERTKHLINTKNTFTQKGFPCRIKLLEGSFSSVLQKEVEEQYDLLLIGARGRLSKDKKGKFGKHTSEILFYTPTSVLVARG